MFAREHEKAPLPSALGIHTRHVNPVLIRVLTPIAALTLKADSGDRVVALGALKEHYVDIHGATFSRL